MHKHRLGEVAARLHERKVVAQEGLELLALAGVYAEARDERTIPDARQLRHVPGAEDLYEESVFRIGVSDRDLVRRGVRNVDDAPDALAGDEIAAVELQVDSDFARRRSPRN